MNFLEYNIIPPTPEQMVLLALIRFITLLVHLPFMAMVMGGSISACAFAMLGVEDREGAYTQAAGLLSAMAAHAKRTLFFLGILPMAILTLTSRQLLYESGVSVLGYQAFSIIPVVAAFVLLLAFKKRLARTGTDPGAVALGALGTLILAGGYYVFIAASVRSGDPEKWIFIDSLPELLLSWNVIMKFGVFVVSSFLAAGVMTLFFRFNWGGGRGNDECDRFLMLFGAGTTLAGALAMPAIWLLYIVTLPESSLSGEVFVASAAAFLFLLATALSAYGVIKSSRPGYGVPGFLFLLLFFASAISVDHFSFDASNREHARVLGMLSEEARASSGEGGAATAPEGEKLVEKGRKIFDDVCSLCHEFNEELVGPPLANVLPKYEGDLEALKAFIAEPVKKNPDYPEMPELGLEPEEIEAVAAFVMEELKNNRRRERDRK